MRKLSGSYIVQIINPKSTLGFILPGALKLSYQKTIYNDSVDTDVNEGNADLKMVVVREKRSTELLITGELRHAILKNGLARQNLY